MYIQSAQNGTDFAASSFAMRVVLISNSGDMRTIVLPNTCEGRYKFLDKNGIDDIPIYIEALSQRWIVSSGHTGYFYRENDETQSDEVIGQTIELSDQMVINACVDGNKYFLYAESEHASNNTFFPYYLEERCEYTIGRLESNDIEYSSIIVSRRHAKISWSGTQWSISDMNSKNGVFVNGIRIDSKGDPTRLFIGDRIFIVGLCIIIGAGFIAINNKDRRVVFHTPKIRSINCANDILRLNTQKHSFDYSFYDRQPRKMIRIDPDPILIEMPPMPLSATKVPLLLRFGSSIMMSGNALLTGNIINAVSSLSHMVFPAITQGISEADRKQYEALRTERYRAYL